MEALKQAEILGESCGLYKTAVAGGWKYADHMAFMERLKLHKSNTKRSAVSDSERFDCDK